MQVWPSQEVSLSGKRTAFICQETSLDQVGSVPMSASPQGLVVQFWITVFSSPLMFAPCSFSVLPAASTNHPHTTPRVGGPPRDHSVLQPADVCTVQL